jgi:hypothetical protein
MGIDTTAEAHEKAKNKTNSKSPGLKTRATAFTTMAIFVARPGQTGTGIFALIFF